MTLQLFMIGLTVKDMAMSQEFYRRLGVAIPDGTEAKPHVEVKMGQGFTLFLDTRTIKPDAPESAETVGGYSAIFEYYLKTEAAVEAKYAELVSCGYRSYRASFDYPNGMRFALVNDPDGNLILLSGDKDDHETPKA